MLRILVVDDEMPIRQWFVFCIEKSGRSFQVIGEAHNGKAALEIFKKELPDVVITDIKMPVMDGLEFIKEARALPSCTADFIILTCHADFDYARQAVKYGAAEYLLKFEVSDTDVIEILDRLEKQRMDREQAEKALYLQSRLKMKLFAEKLLVQGGIREDEIVPNLSEAGIKLGDKNIFAAAVYMDKDFNYSELEKLINDEGLEVFESLYFFNLEDGIFLLLGNLKGCPSQLLQITNLHSYIAGLYKLLGCSTGISNIYQDLRFLKDALYEAVYALKQEFFLGAGKVIYFRDIAGNRGIPEKAGATQKGAVRAASAGDMVLTVQLTDAFFEIIEKSRNMEVSFLYKCCTEILEKAYDYASNAGCSMEFERNEIKDRVGQKRFLGNLRSWMDKSLKAMNPYMGNYIRKYSQAICKALAYMDANYHKALSLKDIAEYVHFNPSYFSHLFKEETGENISVYIMMLRINKAEELLKKTDMKLSEIAEKVGYPNLSHFSRLFKKFKGVNPLQVRKTVRSE